MRRINTDTEIWEQIWFRAMSPINKLAYTYIKDSCNHAGIWKIDLIKLCQDLGIEKFNFEIFLYQANRGIHPLTLSLDTRVRFTVKNGYVWMVDYISFHWGNRKGICSPGNLPVRKAIEQLISLNLYDYALLQGFLILTEPYPKRIATITRIQKN